VKTLKEVRFGQINEARKDKLPADPPAVMLMKRMSIRQFGDGQRVALYHIDKINKYISIPYNASQWAIALPEEFKQE
jgi:hypothetical protein